MGNVLGSMLFGFLGVKFTLRHGRYPVVLLSYFISILTYSLMFLIVINFLGEANNDQGTDKVGLLDYTYSKLSSWIFILRVQLNFKRI